MNYYFLIAMLSIFITSCSSNSDCALVIIKGKEYFLNVDTKNGYVKQIHFPKGGWIDSDHFEAEDAKIESDYAEFYDDRGRLITIDFNGCNNN